MILITNELAEFLVTNVKKPFELYGPTNFKYLSINDEYNKIWGKLSTGKILFIFFVFSESDTSIWTICLGVSKWVNKSFAIAISLFISWQSRHSDGEWKYNKVNGIDSVKFVKFSSVNLGTVSKDLKYNSNSFLLSLILSSSSLSITFVSSILLFLSSVIFNPSFSSPLTKQNPQKVKKNSVKSFIIPIKKYIL